MIELCNTNAVIVCPHTTGVVKVTAGQQAVRIGGAPAVRVTDVPTWAILPGCTQVGPGQVPCAKTILLVSGASPKVMVGGVPALLATATMNTNGAPVFALATVKDPGQHTVSEDV